MATTVQAIHTENLTPRARFQQSGTKLSAHRDLISSEAFRVAIDTALLQYQAELCEKTTDMNTAARTGVCMLGAQEFIGVLRKLAENSSPRPNPINDNLPHRS